MAGTSAITFATDVVDPLQGCVGGCHARMHGSIVAWRCAVEATSARRRRVRWKMRHHGSTGCSHEPWTGVPWQTTRGGCTHHGQTA
jgi:hypothetical protein